VNNHLILRFKKLISLPAFFAALRAAFVTVRRCPHNRSKKREATGILTFHLKVPVDLLTSAQLFLDSLTTMETYFTAGWKLFQGLSIPFRFMIYIPGAGNPGLPELFRSVVVCADYTPPPVTCSGIFLAGESAMGNRIN
jgi:hypothetical protein